MPKYRNESEGNDELGHLAANDYGSVHVDEDMVIVELFDKGITMFFDADEWIELVNLVKEASSANPR